jgi:hypothetical protein
MNLQCLFNGKTVRIVKIESSQNSNFLIISYIYNNILMKKEVSIFGNIATDVEIL